MARLYEHVALHPDLLQTVNHLCELGAPTEDAKLAVLLPPGVEYLGRGGESVGEDFVLLDHLRGGDVVWIMGVWGRRSGWAVETGAVEVLARVGVVSMLSMVPMQRMVSRRIWGMQIRRRVRRRPSRRDVLEPLEAGVVHLLPEVHRVRGLGVDIHGCDGEVWEKKGFVGEVVKVREGYLFRVL
jgi:hypothetical protein